MTNGFCCNGAGDLLALTEGNDHKNTWGYDASLNNFKLVVKGSGRE